MLSLKQLGTVRNIIKGLILIAYLLVGHISFAQDSTTVENAWDERAVEYRHPSSEEIDAYKRNSDYKYDRFQDPETIWQRFMRWLMSRFAGKTVSSLFLKWILYGLAAITFTAIIMVLFGIKIKGLFIFSRNAKTRHPDFAIASDDIHDTKLEDMLRLYIETRALREATRVMYLLILRELDTKGFIRWQTGKTNHDYWYELPNHEIKTEFKTLVLAYEYVWYGEFQLSDFQFDEIQKQYDRFNQNMIYQPTNHGIKKG